MSSRRHLLLALLLTAAVVIPRAYLLSRSHNESSDDDYHLVRGLEFLNRDKGLVHRELNDPPLGEALAALPLRLLGGGTHGDDEGTAIYQQKRYSPETATTLIALWKALLFLPIAAVIFHWCLRVYCPTSAWLALILILFDPAVAAHTHLASLDVLATGAILAACWFGWRCFEQTTRKRLLLASLATAAALLTKHTAVVVPLILIVYAFITPRAKMVGGTHPTRVLATGAVLTLACMWVLLMFDLSPVRGTPLPGGLYVSSILDAARHAAGPNYAYLFGEIKRGGWWYYFPVAAAYKIPLPTACILVLGVASLFWRKPARDELSLAIPAAVYFIFLLAQPIQIGWRHALPAYLPLIMLASRGVTSHPKQLTTVYWLLATLTLLNTTRHPDYVAYFDRPIARPYEILSDSNLDWGQSLKPAGRWIDGNRDWIAGRPVYVRPFAVSNRAFRHYVGERARHLRYGDLPPTSGVLIISPVCLSGVSESADEYSFLRGIPPHRRIGRALYVYDLDRL